MVTAAEKRAARDYIAFSSGAPVPPRPTEPELGEPLVNSRGLAIAALNMPPDGRPLIGGARPPPTPPAAGVPMPSAPAPVIAHTPPPSPLYSRLAAGHAGAVPPSQRQPLAEPLDRAALASAAGVQLPDPNDPRALLAFVQQQQRANAEADAQHDAFLASMERRRDADAGPKTSGR